MCHFNEGKRTKCYYIAEINDNIEKEIENDNIERIAIVINDKSVAIHKNDICFYGEMNFSRDSEDYEVIKDHDNLFNGNSSWIPSYYNYNNHSVAINDDIIKYYESFKPEKIVQYYHGLIGKPKKCIIFKRIV